jgi:uncharacterized lipoprotein
MHRFASLLFAVLAATFLAACASSESKDSTREGREKYSTVPWNRPQNWEGKGVLGGIVQ